MADISPQNDISPLPAEAGDKIVPKHPDIVAEKELSNLVTARICQNLPGNRNPLLAPSLDPIEQSLDQGVHLASELN